VVNVIFFLTLAWLLAVGIVVDLLWDEYHPADLRGCRTASQKFAGQPMVVDIDTLATDILDFFEIVTIDGKPTVRWAW
jgi:hypothetical protein